MALSLNWLAAPQGMPHSSENKKRRNLFKLNSIAQETLRLLPRLRLLLAFDFLACESSECAEYFCAQTFLLSSKTQSAFTAWKASAVSIATRPRSTVHFRLAFGELQRCFVLHEDAMFAHSSHVNSEWQSSSVFYRREQQQPELINQWVSLYCAISVIRPCDSEWRGLKVLFMVATTRTQFLDLSFDNSIAFVSPFFRNVSATFCWLFGCWASLCNVKTLRFG